jgi:hypothetical protein
LIARIWAAWGQPSPLQTLSTISEPRWETPLTPKPSSPRASAVPATCVP